VVGELVFYMLAVAAVGTAIGMLASRNAVHSALFLAANFVTIALLYLNLGAPLIAFTQITVYAGAIMVLFLFVVMLLGGESLPVSPLVKNRRAIAGLLAVVLMAELVLVLLRQSSLLPGLDTASASFGAPREVGVLLFSRYVLPFEITSVILLAAMVGAIVLTKSDQTVSRLTPRLPKGNADGTGH